MLVRALNKLEPTLLSGVDDLRGLFVAPHGEWVGFFDATMLKKIRISGGPAVPVCAVQNTPRGATWNEGNTIIFATNSTSTGLQRVSSDGGQPTVLTKPDREHGEGDHIWPEFLPGGNAVLYTITPISNVIEDAHVAVLDLQTGTSKVLIRGGSHAHFVPTGHLIYGVLGALHAVAFDLKRLAVIGSPVPVLDGVVTKASGAADVAVAANGSLVYIQGGAGGAAQQSVVSVDRQGNPSPLAGLPLDSYRDVRVSPDGGRIALATFADVSIYDRKRANLSRLTTDKAPDHSPLWSANGQHIVFTSTRAGYPELFSRPADGSGSEERLLTRGKDLADLLAMDWSRDGTQLLFNEVPSDIRTAIGQVAIRRDADAIMLMKNAMSNAFPAVSPNGRWIAYQSGLVSSRPDIYIERYPELGDKKKISSEGGRLPLWSRDGQELFFASLDGQQMFAVPMPTQTTALIPGRPKPLFTLAMLPQGFGNRPYDIAPNGEFIIIRSGQDQDDAGRALNMIVVQNWFEELKRLVPVN